MTPGPAPDYRFEIALSFPSQYNDSVVKPVAKVLAKHFAANGRDKILYDHWLKDIPGCLTKLGIATRNHRVGV